MLMILPVVTIASVSNRHLHMLLTGIHTVAGMDLGINLNPTVLWDHLIRNRHTLVDGYSLFDDRVMFHAAPY